VGCFPTYCALPRASPANDGHPLAGLEVEVDVRQNIGTIKVVSDGYVAEFDFARSWPLHGNHVAWVVDEVALDLLGIRDVVLVFRFQGSVLLNAYELWMISLHKRLLSDYERRGAHALQLDFEVVHGSHQAQDGLAETCRVSQGERD
jgi:hypothetical protein